MTIASRARTAPIPTQTQAKRISEHLRSYVAMAAVVGIAPMNHRSAEVSGTRGNHAEGEYEEGDLAMADDREDDSDDSGPESGDKGTAQLPQHRAADPSVLSSLRHPASQVGLD